MLAAVTLAEAAEHAGVHAQPLGVGVRLAQGAGRLRERGVAQARGGLAEDRGAERLALRRRGVRPRARILERVAALDLLALQVAGEAAHTHQVLEPVVERLQLRGR